MFAFHLKQSILISYKYYYFRTPLEICLGTLFFRKCIISKAIIFSSKGYTPGRICFSWQQVRKRPAACTTILDLVKNAPAANKPTQIDPQLFLYLFKLCIHKVDYKELISCIWHITVPLHYSTPNAVIISVTNLYMTDKTFSLRKWKFMPDPYS